MVRKSAAFRSWQLATLVWLALTTAASAATTLFVAGDLDGPVGTGRFASTPRPTAPSSLRLRGVVD
jgi:hypothetical protein